MIFFYLLIIKYHLLYYFQANSLLVLKKVIPVDEENDKSDIFELDGYVSSCDHSGGRSSKDRQFYFINSRPCEPLKVFTVLFL